MLDQLTRPFAKDDVQFKPQAFAQNGNALAVPYLPADVYTKRFNEVCGIRWSRTHMYHEGTQVVTCAITIHLQDGTEITREDGAPVESEKDTGNKADRVKTAFTSAFKRAAKQFGVGLYLAKYKPQWCPYDQRAKQWSTNPADKFPKEMFQNNIPQPPPPTPKSQPTASPYLTLSTVTDGRGLAKQLQEWDKIQVRDGVTEPGEMKSFVDAFKIVHNIPSDAKMIDWKQDKIKIFTSDAFRAFDDHTKSGSPITKGDIEKLEEKIQEKGWTPSQVARILAHGFLITEFKYLRGPELYKCHAIIAEAGE